MGFATKEVHVGPWGGPRGTYSYEFKPNGKITKIYIRTGGEGNCIDSISFGYVDCYGQECRSPIFGGSGGHLSQTMPIETDEEIVEFGGTIGQHGGCTVITSLSFKTNKKTCVFGWVSGTKFSLPVKTHTAKFAGFHGRYGYWLDSIGAILV